MPSTNLNNNHFFKHFYAWRHRYTAILSITFCLCLIPQTGLAQKCCVCTAPDIKNGSFCIKDKLSCNQLATTGNKELSDANCTEMPAKNIAAKCRKIPDGLCLNDPVTALNFKKASVIPQAATDKDKPKTATDVQPLGVDLNIDLPGFTMTQPTAQGGVVTIPFLAQYTQAIQKLLFGVGLIAAAIMIVYGGFLYIVSGTGAKVREGKKIIIDALIGMVIILGSYTILVNINPKTVNLNAIQITAIPKQTYEPITPEQYKAAAKAAEVPATGSLGGMPTASELIDYAMAEAKSRGMDPCIIYAIIKSESGGKALIGHDENVYYYLGASSKLVQSRLNFLRSRKFYSGKDFDSSVPIMPPDGKCVGATRIECQKAAAYPMEYTHNRDKQMKNDDEFVINAPPDYGLDWRFSHGIGYTMATIFPNTPKCPNGERGYHMGGECFTIPQLITKEGSVGSVLARPAYKSGAGPKAVFCGYGGRSVSNCGDIADLVANKEKYYTQCQAKYK